MLRFNGSDRDGSEIAAARATSASKNGAEGPSVETLASSGNGDRPRLRNRIRQVARPGRSPRLRRIEARRRTLSLSSPEELQVELSRSRRYGHRFALMRIPRARGAGAKAGPNGDGDAAVAPGPNGDGDVAVTISSLVRRVDRVWSDGADVYLLLPECDGAMAEGMLARIRERLAEFLSEEARLAISSAVFPDDGFTSGALLGALDRRSVTSVSQKAQIVPSPPTPEAQIVPSPPTPEAPVA